MEVLVEPRTLRFAAPVATAYGTLTERTVVELVLRDDGVAARGEAAPLEPYDGVPVEAVLVALDAYRPVLERVGELSGAQVLDACRELGGPPQALAAVDIALWDLAGRREGAPIAALLAGEPAPSVAVNATIGATDRAGAASAALDAARA